MKKAFTKQASEMFPNRSVANKANATQYTHQRLSWQVQILCWARMTLEREWQSWYRGGKSEWQNNRFFSSNENEPSLLYIRLDATNTQNTMKQRVVILRKSISLEKETLVHLCEPNLLQ